MRAGTIGAYVQDGLVACWDGIENFGPGIHKSDTNVWKDVVGGREFALHGVTVNADRMTFAGKASSYGNLSATDTTSTFVAAKSGTLEIVYAASGVYSSGAAIVNCTIAGNVSGASGHADLYHPTTSGSVVNTIATDATVSATTASCNLLNADPVFNLNVAVKVSHRGTEARRILGKGF